MRALVLLLLLACGSPAAAQSEKEAAALRGEEEQGRLLFEVDRAGWVATDDMVERLGGRRDVPIKGWVVERDGEADYVVTYYGSGAAGPVAWYRGRVRDSKLVSGELFPAAARPGLTPAQLSLVRAADAARKYRKYRPCTAAPFNLAILPPRPGNTVVDAYLLSAQTAANTYPMGGHYLLRIGADGKIVSHRRFMKTCMNMAPPEAAPGEPVALVLTHLLDPHPTEIHVFMSIWIDKPVYVATENGRLWKVERGKIERLPR